MSAPDPAAVALATTALALDRMALTHGALAVWRDFRNELTPDQADRIYAELVGALAYANPVTLADFVTQQRARLARLAEIDAELDAEDAAEAGAPT